MYTTHSCSATHVYVYSLILGREAATLIQFDSFIHSFLIQNEQQQEATKQNQAEGDQEDCVCTTLQFQLQLWSHYKKTYWSYLHVDVLQLSDVVYC